MTNIMNIFILLLIFNYTYCIDDITTNEYNKYTDQISEDKITGICERSKIYSSMIYAVRSKILENIDENNIQIENNIDLFLNPNTNKKIINLLSDEFITYYDIYNFPFEDLNKVELSLFYDCLQDNEEKFMNLAKDDILWNNWPINIYVKNRDNIYTLNYHKKPKNLYNIILNISFPKNFNKVKKLTKEYQRKIETINNQISKHDIFVENTPNEFIEEFVETNNNKYLQIERHHIIPLDLLSDFFNRFLTIQRKCINSSQESKIRNIKILMINSRYLNYIRALIGNLLKRGISITNIRELFNNSGKSLYLWNPGNLFYGPVLENKSHDFEKTSEIIVNEYIPKYSDNFKEMKQLYNRLKNLNNTFNENTFITQCEEYSELFFDLMITFNKVNNGRRGIFGIKCDSKHWNKVDKDNWEIIQNDDSYTSFSSYILGIYNWWNNVFNV